MPVEQVNETPMDGVYHVVLESGESFYSNADGSHFLVGDLYQNADNGLVNLTEQARNQERATVRFGHSSERASRFSRCG